MQRTAGFTLLELLVVIGVLSVLTGLSLGYLGRTDPERIANAVLAGELRAAQLTARAEGVPTEVLLRPGVDGYAGSIVLSFATNGAKANSGVFNLNCRARR